VVFRWQVPLLGRFIADFLAPAERLVIEVDGGHHAEQAGRMRAVRRSWLALAIACAGWMRRSSCETPRWPSRSCARRSSREAVPPSEKVPGIRVARAFDPPLCVMVIGLMRSAAMEPVYLSFRFATRSRIAVPDSTKNIAIDPARCVGDEGPVDSLLARPASAAPFVRTRRSSDKFGQRCTLGRRGKRPRR
jgi:Protein of unknown function (DUF559)